MAITNTNHAGMKNVLKLNSDNAESYMAHCHHHIRTISVQHLLKPNHLPKPTDHKAEGINQHHSDRHAELHG